MIDFIKAPPELEIGNAGFYVELLQFLLKMRGADIKITGFYDVVTYQALREFRKRHYLTGPALTDLQTWQFLLDEERR